MTICFACESLAKELFRRSKYDLYRRQKTRVIEHLANLQNIISSAECCGICSLIKTTLIETCKPDMTDSDDEVAIAGFFESNFSHDNIVFIAKGDCRTQNNWNVLYLTELAVKVIRTSPNPCYIPLALWGNKGIEL